MNETIITNDETGEFVMTKNITRVIIDGESRLTKIFVRQDMVGGQNYMVDCCIYSSLSPKELHRRLYSVELNNPMGG